MLDEIQLSLADGGTCSLRRECLIITKKSISESYWQYLLVLPALVYGSMPGFMLLLIAVILILLECLGVPVIAFLNRLEVLVAALLVLWVFGLLFTWLRLRQRIPRAKLLALQFQGDSCSLSMKSESRELRLRFSDPEAAQSALKSLGWESQP
ncbi:MAG: hypothetical protein RL095_3906 [Verrucomicrobiota bacterium]|jgi:hypothetical protein